MTLPTGTVSFLFTDIEGSTQLLQRLGDGYREVLAEHDRLLRDAVAGAGGVEVSTEGDAFFCVFATAAQAVEAAVAAQRALASYQGPGNCRLLVRMGIHTGEATLGGDNYVGLDVHRAARIADAGHGGQVLLSMATCALVDQSLPTGVTLRDLGEHRLKDLAQPERLFQLVLPGLPEEFPPLRTLDATPHNLPVQLTSFVGREQEVAEAVRRLQGTRLLTLTGPGGTGKTRLSLQVAAEVAEQFHDGVFFVPLAPVTDPALVPSTIVGVLGIQQPTGPPLKRLVNYLADRRLLLVLDNFEQVLEGGPVVAQLLQAAPELKVLVTSRAPLRVSGEQELPIPPLRVPDLRHLPSLDALSRYEAVGLFTERAMAVRPDFSLDADNAAAVAEIATRLDGLPLAIELAAARVKLLPPQAMVRRLENRLGLLAGGSRDLPTRQQTLRDAISWSYDLLDQPGRRLLERMAVFSGGARLEEAEVVCGPPEDLGVDPLDGLGLLVDQSLLRQDDTDGEPRFWMLETIREFALERLEAGDDAMEIRRRHARVFLELAQKAEPELTGRNQALWLDRLEGEHDNLRTALHWATEHGHGEIALCLATALWRFWQIRGYLDEARQRLSEVLALPGEYPEARAKALEAAGGVAYWQGDFEAARGLYQESLERLEQLGDRGAVANALYNLSFPYGMTEQPDVEKADGLLQQALGIYEELGDPAGVAKVLWGMGNMAYWQGDPERGLSLLSQSEQKFRDLGDPFGLGWALFMMGQASIRTGDYQAARSYLEQGLEMFAEVRDVSAVVMHLAAFSGLAVIEEDHERAVRLGGAIAALQKASGTGLVDWLDRQIPDFRQAVELLGDQRFEALLQEGQAMTPEQTVAYALGRSPG
ncbi:MAG: tetratricopeptide repeat protein [Actinomycetota bacterium]|nr:tetratricopeptide repeat protein [Actinomycetota bacterium]